MCDSDYDEYEEEIEETKQIQQKFMEIVKEMIEKKIEFPKAYKSFYLITEYHDRRGHGITLKPFLLHENAESKKPDDQCWEGKYGRSIRSTIVSCEDKVNLDCCEKSYKHCGGASYNFNH